MILMTKLDKFLVRREWDHNGEEFFTQKDGLGFAIYWAQGQMVVAGMSKAAIDESTRIHPTVCKTHKVKTILNVPGGGRDLVPHLFVIPANAEVVAAAVSSAFDVRF
jgi:hypothetical protein